MFALTESLWWLVTLGGSPGHTAAGSPALAWVNFALTLAVFAGVLDLARFWFREARRSLTRSGGRAKATMGWLCVAGGFAGFGVSALMTWVPAWSLLLLARGLTLALLVAYRVQVRGVKVVFARADAAHLIRHDLSNLRMRAPLLSPAQITAGLDEALAKLDAAMKAEQPTTGGKS